jgi:hypothetical protein
VTGIDIGSFWRTGSNYVVVQQVARPFFFLHCFFASRTVIARVKDTMIKDMRAAGLARIFLKVEIGK